MSACRSSLEWREMGKRRFNYQQRFRNDDLLDTGTTERLLFRLECQSGQNVSNVEKLAEGVDYIYFNGDSNFPINVGARPGHKLGEIYAKTLYKRDEQGNIIINKENGLPMTTTDADERLAKPIGNIQPNLLMSVSPSFTYKGFTLSAMFDMKFGGDIISISEMNATGSGMAKRTMNRGESDNFMMIFPEYMKTERRIPKRFQLPTITVL